MAKVCSYGPLDRQSSVLSCYACFVRAVEDGEEEDKALVRVVCIWKSGKNSRKVSKMVITVEKGHKTVIMVIL